MSDDIIKAVGRAIREQRTETNERFNQVSKDMEGLKEVAARANARLVLDELKRIYQGEPDMAYLMRYTGIEMDQRYLGTPTGRALPSSADQADPARAEQIHRYAVDEYGELELKP
ncbi:MAG: hypothetical protein MI808_22015 [Pseudomonadales bacterium]|nr:hypothetical protein [Pseudomonadales bacterium]